MEKTRRSNCPISFSLDIIGDRWTLLILRDLVLTGKKHYQELLEAGEDIATNVLADRLQRLEQAGMITKRRDPHDGKRFLYAATEKGFDTLPIMLEMIVWGARYDPKTAAPKAFVDRIHQNRGAVIAKYRKKIETG